MDITALLTPEIALILVFNIMIVQLIKKNNDFVPDKASPIVALLTAMVLSTMYHNYDGPMDMWTITTTAIIVAFGTVYTYETGKSGIEAILSIAKKKK